MCKPKSKRRPSELIRSGKNNGISWLSFNVEGLSSQLDDPNFHELINRHDINILTETWRNTNSKLNLPNFWDYSQIRPKHVKAFRYSGGISILIKKELRPGIKIVKDIEGFVWFKLCKVFFDLCNDLYVCASYIPPQYTTK